MKSFFLFPLILIVFASCGEDDATLEPRCGSFAVIDDLEYEKVSHPFTIEAAAIEGNCLNVTFGFSGCADDGVTIKLVGEENISKSYPVQRNLKLLVSDAGACQAFFTKTLSFDLTPALANGEELMYFNLEGWEDKLIYGIDPGKCDASTLIDGEEFEKESHPVQIQKLVLEGDCLELTFAFSGCRDDIDIKLVDKGVIAESGPAQRHLKLILEDAGDCEAAFSKTMSFNLTPTRINDDNSVIFRLEGWEDSFQYNY